MEKVWENDNREKTPKLAYQDKGKKPEVKK